VLDVLAARRDGQGVDLVIVIGGPLGGDLRSLARLMRKFDNYLSFIVSPEFSQRFGPPKPDKTRIVVRIAQGSSPAAFDLLERCKPWVAENNATLVVERIPAP